MSGTIFLQAREISVDERDGSVTITILRSGDLSQPASATWEITSATVDPATHGLDFDGPLSGVAAFEAGQDRVTVVAPILDDALAEPTEAFILSITGVSDADLGAPRTTRVNILDDETPAPVGPEPSLEPLFDTTLQPVLSGLIAPIDFAFSPVDPNLIFVASKLGRITTHDATTGEQVATFLDIAAQTNSSGDRGLLDFALHPNFPADPYVYVFYVVDPADTAGQTGAAGGDGEGNRFSYVSRFEVDPATNFTSVIADSEVVLIGGAGQTLADIAGGGAINSGDPVTIDPSSPLFTPASDIDPVTGEPVQDYLKVDSSTHAGGALAFGPDGALYVSVGDGSSFNAIDPRAASVQNIDALAGKVLRIDAMTGDGLPDNPFVEDGADLSANRSKVFQLGLRNPFSMGFDDAGRLFITETGWNSWEEINVGGPGANFGWPWFEGGDSGVSLRSPYQNLPEAQAFYAAVEAGEITLTQSFRAFAHAEAEPGYAFIAITGGSDVYGGGGGYPSSLDNHYFFSNLPGGQIFAIDVNDRRDVKLVGQVGDGFAPVHYIVGPDGKVYYANIATGEVGVLQIQARAVDMALSGSAAAGATAGEFILTPDASQQTGLIASEARVDMTRVTTFDFDIFLGDKDGGGDGMTFVLHADPMGAAATGGAGSGFGVAGLLNGLAIEFDTFRNGGGSDDLVEDHVALFTTDGAFRTAPVAVPNLEDGAWRRVVVVWEPVDQTLTVSLDGVVLIEQVIDLSAILGGTQAHFGWSASTGGVSNQQAVRINAVDAIYEPAAATLIRVEAENLTIVQGFSVANNATASGGKILQANGGGEQIAAYAFEGRAGIYDLKLAYFDENDAVSQMSIFVNGAEVDNFLWDQDLGSAGPNAQTLTSRVLDGLDLRQGDLIELRGFRAPNEPLRTDYLEFSFVEDIPNFRVEAESMTLIQGFSVNTNKAASLGGVIQANGGGLQRASYDFTARDGVYDLTLGYFDENDAVSSMSILVNGVEIDSFLWDKELGSAFPNAQTLTTRVISDVVLHDGDVVEIQGVRAPNEPLRTDYLDFAYTGKIPADLPPPPPPAPPAPVRIEAENLTLVQGFTTAARKIASGGFNIEGGGSGEKIATHTFAGVDGVYSLRLGYFDENDGVATMQVLVNGSEIDAFLWNSDTGSALADGFSLTERVIGDVALSDGDTIELRGFAAPGEPLRTDYLDIVWVDELLS